MWEIVCLAVIGLANLGFSVWVYKRPRRETPQLSCRYPDTNVRDILIDYELEKAKKLDEAIHKIEDKK